MGCACGGGGRAAPATYTVTTKQPVGGKTTHTVTSMPEVRRMLTQGGGGTYQRAAGKVV